MRRDTGWRISAACRGASRETPRTRRHRHSVTTRFCSQPSGAVCFPATLLSLTDRHSGKYEATYRLRQPGSQAGRQPGRRADGEAVGELLWRMQEILKSKLDKKLKNLSESKRKVIWVSCAMFPQRRPDRDEKSARSPLRLALHCYQRYPQDRNLIIRNGHSGTTRKHSLPEVEGNG